MVYTMPGFKLTGKAGLKKGLYSRKVAPLFPVLPNDDTSFPSTYRSAAPQSEYLTPNRLFPNAGSSFIFILNQHSTRPFLSAYFTDRPAGFIFFHPVVLMFLAARPVSFPCLKSH